MRLIKIESLKVGEKLSSPIRMQDGRVLLPANATITEAYITRLKGFGIASVYVEDEFFNEVQIKPCLSEETKMQALKVIGVLYTHLEKVKNKPSIDDSEVKHTVKQMVSDVRSAMSEPIGLVDLYTVNDQRCRHAVNTATIVAAMAMDYGCNYAAIEEYTQAALLHDIMLKDMSEDQGLEHAWQGHELLKSTYTFSARTYMSVAAHHEKYDGSGGPRRLKGREIPEGARMIAIADLYDNLVYGYGGHKKYSLHHAFEYLNMESGRSLDPQLLGCFNSTVAIYPTGAIVWLNNGLRAVVTEQNPKMPARPKVRLCMPKKEECLQLNLVTQKTTFIDKIEL